MTSSPISRISFAFREQAGTGVLDVYQSDKFLCFSLMTSTFDVSYPRLDYQLSNLESVPRDHLNFPIDSIGGAVNWNASSSSTAWTTPITQSRRRDKTRIPQITTQIFIAPLEEWVSIPAKYIEHQKEDCMHQALNEKRGGRGGKTSWAIGSFSGALESTILLGVFFLLVFNCSGVRVLHPCYLLQNSLPCPSWISSFLYPRFFVFYPFRVTFSLLLGWQNSSSEKGGLGAF